MHCTKPRFTDHPLEWATDYTPSCSPSFALPSFWSIGVFQPALVPRQLHSRSLFFAERATGHSTETPQHQVNIAKVLLSRVPVPKSLLAANSPLSQEAGALNHYKASIRSVFFSVAD